MTAYDTQLQAAQKELTAATIPDAEKGIVPEAALEFLKQLRMEATSDWKSPMYVVDGGFGSMEIAENIAIKMHECGVPCSITEFVAGAGGGEDVFAPARDSSGYSIVNPGNCSGVAVVNGMVLDPRLSDEPIATGLYYQLMQAMNKGRGMSIYENHQSHRVKYQTTPVEERPLGVYDIKPDDSTAWGPGGHFPEGHIIPELAAGTGSGKKS